jgi:hypothetical protein
MSGRELVSRAGTLGGRIWGLAAAVPPATLSTIQHRFPMGEHMLVGIELGFPHTYGHLSLLDVPSSLGKEPPRRGNATPGRVARFAIDREADERRKGDE